MITYEQAKEAHSRGEKVEYRGCETPRYFSLQWRPWDGYVEQNRNLKLEFRLAEDPYAELKAAHKAGKVIQVAVISGGWADISDPDWSLPPECYRVKPELKIEAGKEYQLRNGERFSVLTISAEHPTYKIVGERHSSVVDGHSVIRMLSTGRYNGREDHDNDIVAPWTDTPAPYDNWQHVPAWANWQTMDRAGNWYWSTEKPENNGGYCAFISHCGIILREFTPTNFTGTWETSLQERPKI